MKTKAVLMSSCLLSLLSCNSDAVDQVNEAAAPQKESKEEANTIVYNNLVAMTEPLSRAEGKTMVENFRNLVKKNQMGNLEIPMAMIIEEEYLKSLLELVDEQGTGGIIMYPVDNGKGRLSLAITAASFPTDAQGDMTDEKPTVLYPTDDEGNQYVFEFVRPVPPGYVMQGTGLDE